MAKLISLARPAAGARPSRFARLGRLVVASEAAVAVVLLFSACSLNRGPLQEGPKPTPVETMLSVPGVPTPVGTVEALLPWPTPVPTALPTLTPRPSVLPAYTSRCSTPAPRPYPMAQNWVGYLTPTPVAELALARSFDTWCYQILRIPGHVRADVSYDRSTVAALEAFAETNRLLASDLAAAGGKATMLVYFRRPLDPDEYRQWVREQGISVEATLGDCDNCPTGGLGWRTATSDDPFTDQMPEYHQVAVGLWGSLDAARLPQVASSPPVFIADLTANIIRRDLEASGAPDAAYLETFPYFEEMPIWPMRLLGLQTFEYHYP